MAPGRAPPPAAPKPAVAGLAGDDDDTPPGFEAPSTSSAAAAAETGEALSKVAVAGGDGSAAGEIDVPADDDASAAADAAAASSSSVRPESMYSSSLTFEELNVPEDLLKGLYSEMKFERPSRVQAQTLPMALHPPYRSLIAQAHNGSGKTTAFTLAMLCRVDPSVPKTQALCVCPTRELAIQNLAVLDRIGSHSSITRSSTAEPEAEAPAGGGGGARARPSRRRAKVTDQVVVGTPGRLRDWMAKRVLDVSGIKVLVFDEADEMLKQDGFADDTVRMIKTLRAANPDLQILLFSATFNERVKKFAQKVVPGAHEVFVPREDLSLDVIKQYRVVCPTALDKLKVLKEMIFPQCEKLGQTIIFVRSRQQARDLHKALENEGHRCTSIEGGMELAARDRVVKEFRDGTTKILISTDVLSRGFDVTQVTLVVNYDPPVERDFVTPNYETYLHRIGRSGRFGRKGAAFNLVCGQAEARVIDQIADYFKHPIPGVPYDDEDAFLAVLQEAGLAEQD